MTASSDVPQPGTQENDAAQRDHHSVPEGVILERFKRMQTLPPHMRNLQDEFFVQSYLRKKRFAV